MNGSESRDDLVGQYAYLADELEAQRAVLALIPEPLVGVVPPGSDWSLLDLYGRLALQRPADDRKLLAPWIGQSGPLPEASREVSLDVLVDVAIAERRALAELLESIPPERWDEAADGPDLAGRVLEMISKDTEILRAIAERLFEGGLRGRIPTV